MVHSGEWCQCLDRNSDKRPSPPTVGHGRGVSGRGHWKRGLFSCCCHFNASVAETAARRVYIYISVQKCLSRPWAPCLHGHCGPEATGPLLLPDPHGWTNSQRRAGCSGAQSMWKKTRGKVAARTRTGPAAEKRRHPASRRTNAGTGTRRGWRSPWELRGRAAWGDARSPPTLPPWTRRRSCGVATMIWNGWFTVSNRIPLCPSSPLPTIPLHPKESRDPPTAPPRHQAIEDVYLLPTRTFCSFEDFLSYHPHLADCTFMNATVLSALNAFWAALVYNESALFPTTIRQHSLTKIPPLCSSSSAFVQEFHH